MKHYLHDDILQVAGRNHSLVCINILKITTGRGLQEFLILNVRADIKDFQGAGRVGAVVGGAAIRYHRVGIGNYEVSLSSQASGHDG